MLDRTIAPPSERVADVNLIEAQTVALANKSKVHRIAAGTQPVAKIELIFQAGAAYEKHVGRSYFAAKMLLEGTKNHSGTALSQQFDYYGAFVDINAGLDFVTLTVHTTTKNFEAVVGLLSEMVGTSTFPEPELHTLKNLKAQELKVNLQKNNFRASRMIRTSLFGASHPYGKSMSIADAEDTTRQEVVDYYQQVLYTTPDIVVSGGVGDRENDMIAASIGKQPFSKPLANDEVPIQKERPLIVEEVAESLQSSIRLAGIMVPRNHPDHLSALVVNELLGGYFGSRLMKNIREDKGFTYGIHSTIASLQNNAMLIIGTDVKKEYTRQTLDEINFELERLAREPVPAKELETVKNYMTGSFLSSINTPFSLADKFKAIYFHQQNYDYYQRYLQAINQITSEEIMVIADKYFKPSDLQTVVVGQLA